MGIPYSKADQLKHTRRIPKRGHRGMFRAKTRKYIIERDNGLCVRCGAQFEEIHHIHFRSQGGLGTADNGCCVCKSCHDLAHKFAKVRKWFEQFRLKLLDGGSTE